VSPRDWAPGSPTASTAVAAGADAETIAETIHVHPALSEVVQGAFRDVCDVAPSGI
jgi:dihydrolipoamide dehydrogenase